MKRLIPMFALVLAFTAGAGAAAGAVAVSRAASWPAGCTTNACLNTHLNDLNTRVKSLNNTTFSKLVVVTDVYKMSDEEYPESFMTVVPCGNEGTPDFRGSAISGGVSISGPNADQWQVFTSGPPTAMNSWPIQAHNPEYQSGDPLPTMTVFAICLN